MTVFISHSFENKPEFENIVDALEQRSIPYWNPSEVGASSREQLRTVVDHCEVCIFVATRHYRFELVRWARGFLGAGKPIIGYLAEPSLTENELPPIIQGNVYERRIARIADSAKEVLDK